MFNFKICEDESLLDYNNKFNRIAVRAVIIKGEKILLVKSNRCDYKFPGGGVNKGESHKEAIIREVEEETGYRVAKVLDLIGEIQEVSKNRFDDEGAFVMDSYYYKCNVTEERFNQSLDSYEKELGFVGEWVDIKEAIINNESIIEKGNPDKIDWIVRETLALKNI
ncbi:MAG: NUDIX domain-containing protein [Clostridium sp.]